MRTGDSKYLFAHEEDGVRLLFIMMNQMGFAHPALKRELGIPLFRDHWLVFKEGSELWYPQQAMYERVSDAIERRIDEDKSYSTLVIKESLVAGSKLHRECYNALSEIEKGKLSVTRFERIFEYFYRLCGLGIGAVLSDLEHHRLSSKLEAIVLEKITQYRLKRSVGDYLGVLTQAAPRLYTRDARRLLFRIVQKAQRTTLDHPDVIRLIEQYVSDFGWISYGHHGPALSASAVAAQVKELLGSKKGRARLKDDLDAKKIKRAQQQCGRILHLSFKERSLFRAARDFNTVKAYRGGFMFLTFYTIDHALRFLARSRSIPLASLHNMTPDEFLGVLRGKKLPSEGVLKQRHAYSISWVRGFRDCDLLTGDKARRFSEKNTPPTEFDRHIQELKGFIACSGRARGKVRIVKSVNDISKVVEGDILVAAQTIPQYLPAMSRAAAFVTEIGGITSHAAIVARELGKPCIIGTKVATQVLEDGDMVEVDATQGIVKKI